MQGVGLDTSQLQRAAPLITGFLLGYVAALPAAGRISDLVGRRAVLISCLLLFAAGAVVTASAHGLGHAVAGRLLQGLGAGGVVPPTLALVADLWPADRRAVPRPGSWGGPRAAGRCGCPRPRRVAVGVLGRRGAGPAVVGVARRSAAAPRRGAG
jgi:MFS family permease